MQSAGFSVRKHLDKRGLAGHLAFYAGCHPLNEPRHVTRRNINVRKEIDEIVGKTMFPLAKSVSGPSGVSPQSQSTESTAQCSRKPMYAPLLLECSHLTL